MKKNKEPITIYWSPQNLDSEDWSFLYPKPETVFLNLMKYKALKDNSTIFSCPAFTNKFRKILTFFSPMSCSYNYNDIEDRHEIINTTKNYISGGYVRKANFKFGPSISFKINVILFAEESLEMSFTPPYFHTPEYMKYGSVLPGQFNIGEWFRPTNFEVQMWSNHGEFHLKEDEPIFYTEFHTDRPIILKRFTMNEKLIKYSESVTGTTELFGGGLSLLDRYRRFHSIGMREKVLTEIKKNLIEEDPYIF